MVLVRSFFLRALVRDIGVSLRVLSLRSFVFVCFLFLFALAPHVIAWAVHFYPLDRTIVASLSLMLRGLKMQYYTHWWQTSEWL